MIVVTHATPVRVAARVIDHEGTPPETIALGFYIGDSVIARGVVAESAMPAINALLSDPVTVALAASEDPAGNIEGRVCIVVRVSQEGTAGDDAEDEPWKESVPPPPYEAEPESADSQSQGGLALVPLGNVMRSAGNRQHTDLASDAREMLANLLTGRAQDAVSRAIDDLLDSI